MHRTVESRFLSESPYTRGGWGLLINGNSGVGKTVISKELERRLQENGFPATHVPFDRDRHQFSPSGNYHYTDDNARRQTYINAARHYAERLIGGEVLIIDTGARDDTTRQSLVEIRGIHFVYLQSPIYVMIMRETIRSLKSENIEMQRGRFLYLRAILSFALPKSKRFPQPGITIPFVEPSIEPHVTVSTHRRTIDKEVDEILTYLRQNGLLTNRY